MALEVPGLPVLKRRSGLPKLPQNSAEPLQNVSHTKKPFELDIFENPYGAPRPTASQNPTAAKKEIPKNPKTPIIPKSKRSSPKSKRSFPKSKRSFPKSKR